jgi:gluconolactonase
MYCLSNEPIREQAQVWSEMPDRYRATARRTSWADANKSGEVIDSFLEGPVFDGAGNLYVTDIPYGRIFRIDEQKQWELLIEYDGEPNGMKWLREGVLLITDYQNGLMQLDVVTGELRTYLARKNSERFKGLNDLTVDSQGRVYFTDQGQTGLHDPTGRVYRLAPDGQLTQLMGNVPSPNGIVLSPDEKTLYVAATRGNEVWRSPIMSDASVSKVGRYFSSHGPSGPDGLAMDELSHLIVANPGLGCVWRLNGFGEPTHIWTSPNGLAVTNIAFGGANGQQLFMTESQTGSILVCDAPVRGATVFHVVR